MQYWLLKSEGDSYPIDALKKDGKTAWTGIRNYWARNFMRDDMRVGDLCLFYHSGSDMGVYGVARVVSESYPDPTQFDRNSDYFDEKATKAKPTWMLVDIEYVRALKRPVTLAEIKAEPELSGMMLTKPIRLSVQPVSEKHFRHITETKGRL